METQGSGLVKWIITVVIGGAVIVSGLMGTCVYFGMQGPDTRVLSGRQTPVRFVDQIRSLGVLEPEEQIQYFYSDALFDIEEGFYLVTDRNVVIYSQAVEDPAIVIPFRQIASVSADYSDNWMEDSLITITILDDSEITFPASPEGGGDKRMVEAINKKIGQAQDDELRSTSPSPNP